MLWLASVSVAAFDYEAFHQHCQKALQPLSHYFCAGPEICTLLHVATFGSIIACLLRHFRSSLASLPLLSQPVGNLPIGTWSPASRQAQQEEGTMPEVTPDLDL